MKIHMYTLYKIPLIFFAISAVLIITGFLTLAIIVEAWFLLIFGVILGIFMLCLPIVVSYRQLTTIEINFENCSSYSLIKKHLCTVDFFKKVYCSFFYVTFTYSAPLKFVAISNQPFNCDYRRFYRTYNLKKIIIFPYSEQAFDLIKTAKNIEFGPNGKTRYKSN